MKQRIKKLMASVHDDEAVLISSYPNIFYYSGFTSPDAYLLLTHDKKYIITDSRYFIQARREAPDMELYDISKGVYELIKKIPETNIGYEEEHLTVSRYKKLKKKLAGKQELVKMQKSINAPRRIKDKHETEKIKAAQSIGDMAFSHILNFIRPGISEAQVALELEFYMRSHGAKALSFDTICASGVRSAMPHGTASDKIIKKGDILTLDFGCVYKGYCSDMTRTVAIGSISDTEREVYGIVSEAQKRALKSIKPGVKCSYVDSVARKYITDAGYGKNFGHGLGHSVGIEIHEMPSLSPKCNDTVKKGHILTVEPGIYIDGHFGVRIEDLVSVGDDGIVNLTDSEKELIIV